MKITGIRFYPTSISVEKGDGAPIFVHRTLEENRADFDLIFRPLYGFWRHLVFVHDGIIRIFDPRLSEEGEEALEKKLRSYSLAAKQGDHEYDRRIDLMPGKVFEEFGKYVYEFEGAGFCLFNPDVSLQRALEIERDVWGSARLETLPEEVVCLLQNWDGVFWQIFTPDMEFLRILQAQHAGSDTLPAYWVELSDDFPNPRGSSSKEVDMKRVEPVSDGSAEAPPGGEREP